MLLSVLGEGSFCVRCCGSCINMRRIRVTREVARLVSQDEARHVAFGLAHLTRHVHEDPYSVGWQMPLSVAMTCLSIRLVLMKKCSMPSVLLAAGSMGASGAAYRLGEGAGAYCGYESGAYTPSAQDWL